MLNTDLIFLVSIDSTNDIIDVVLEFADISKTLKNYWNLFSSSSSDL